MKKYKNINMKTAEDYIYDFWTENIDEEIGSENWVKLIGAIRDYSTLVAKEALKNASENISYVCGSSRKVKGKYTESCGKWCGGCDSLIADEYSILNESNIPEL